MSRWIIIVLVLILAGCGGESAQIPTLMVLGQPTAGVIPQNQLLNFGEPVHGTLSIAGEVSAWKFAGQQGDSVRVEASGQGLSLALTLQAADGTVLAQGDRIQVILPEGGLYTVRVQLVTGAGDYELLLTHTSSPIPVESTTTPLPEVVGVPTPTPPYANLGAFISKLTSGETIDGAFAESAQNHVYLFDGIAGQYVNIDMIRLSGTVDPVLTLYSPSGVPLATDDNSGGNRAARLRNIHLPEDGLYSLQASGSGFTGGYRITFTSDASPLPVTPNYATVQPTVTPMIEVLTPTLATAVSGNRLERGVPVIGVLNRMGDFNRFPIFAAAEEVLTIGASPLPGYNLRLKLEVYGPAGDQVAAASSSSSNAGGAALISPLRIETTGAYIVYVTSEDSATGEYQISYDWGSTYASIMRGESLPNQPNQGDITRRGMRDVWSVYLNRGDVITASVNSADGIFDPILELIKVDGTPDGALVAVDDNSGGSRNALIANATIPEPGLYHLRVKAAQAATTGKYTLIWRYVNLSPTTTPPPGTVLLLSVDDVAPDNTYLFYPFQGQAGQRVEIRVIAQPGSDFDPVAALIGPDGMVVAEGDDSGGTLNPVFFADLPVEGTYTVRVNGYLKGGPFELTVKALF